MITSLVSSHWCVHKGKTACGGNKKSPWHTRTGSAFFGRNSIPPTGLLFLIALHKSDSPPHILLRPSSGAIGPAPKLRRIPLLPSLPSRISSKGLLMVSAPLSVSCSVCQLSRHHLYSFIPYRTCKVKLFSQKRRFFPVFSCFSALFGTDMFFSYHFAFHLCQKLL